ncbi:MAG: ATP-binding protein [Pseudomonadota bacterium]
MGTRGGEGGTKRPGLTRGARRKRPFSRLTLQIVAANLFGLAVFLVGAFTANQYRDGLIEAKLEGVRAQAQLMADVLGRVAIDETACDGIPEYAAIVAEGGVCPVSLSRRNVKQIFNLVWDSFEGRVRIFAAPPYDAEPPVSDPNAILLEDVVLRRDVIETEPLTPIDGPRGSDAVRAYYNDVSDWVSGALPGGFRKKAAARTLEEELNAALLAAPTGERESSGVRLNEDGELVASVSVPVRRVQAIYGLVTAEIGGIDDLVTRARYSVVRFFAFGAVAAIISSFLLTAGIARPIRQLAVAADKVREGISAASRARIPDFSARKDEIGELSTSLKSMTAAIYERMEAIETFAADVAHELKNPLTSIRSASETLQIAKTPEAQEKLLSVIRNDVARMDRLITDISNASRLDAELARETREPVEIRGLVGDIVDIYAATIKEGDVPVRYDRAGDPLYLVGNPSALGQVFRNLVDNARSFTPAGGTVRVRVRSTAGGARVTVDDDGPGVPAQALEKIFSRFYTKRPAGAAFGANSGLGLAISRQIARSHGGDVRAQNRGDPQAPDGARFIVDLPIAR